MNTDPSPVAKSSAPAAKPTPPEPPQAESFSRKPDDNHSASNCKQAAKPAASPHVSTATKPPAKRAPDASLTVMSDILRQGKAYLKDIKSCLVTIQRYDDDAGSLAAECQDYRDECRSHHANTKSYQHESNDLRAEMHDVWGQAEAAKDNATSACEELERDKDKVMTLFDEIKELCGKTNAHRSELQEYRDEIKALRDEVTALRNEIRVHEKHSALDARQIENRNVRNKSKSVNAQRDFERMGNMLSTLVEMYGTAQTLVSDLQEFSSHVDHASLASTSGEYFET